MGSETRTIQVAYGFGYLSMDISINGRAQSTSTFRLSSPKRAWAPILKCLAAFDAQRIPYTLRIRELRSF